MKQVIRQVFGTTRPRDIWLDLFTFDRLLSRPIVHIIYWCGLGVLIIFAFGVLGVAIGQALKGGDIMDWVLAVPLLVVGWLMVLVGILLWRASCEFFLAVMSIAEDLRVLRQYQEKLEMPKSAPAQRSEAEFDVATPVQEEPVQPAHAGGNPGDILEDPFFRPRFERRDI